MNDPSSAVPPDGPIRTCIGCRRTDHRADMLRIVLRDGQPPRVIPDPGARLPGRGAWLHSSENCLARAQRIRAFARAFRVRGEIDTSEVDTDVLGSKTTTLESG